MVPVGTNPSLVNSVEAPAQEYCFMVTKYFLKHTLHGTKAHAKALGHLDVISTGASTRRKGIKDLLKKHKGSKAPAQYMWFTRKHNHKAHLEFCLL
jgi:hypothetical protein